ncbi:hypothetical protein GTY65_12520 [Streptomyces sp. SID8379]|uniref:hypothetical protein n=1 Tax=unclassified Streptomyces TaxID=2593676 RepID=UPI00036DC814|nr:MULTISPECIES: hypothetical protein [unclassified Streptomyces]MYW64884.1 hypothetical protein [Streptomyces sp. SID8379]
MTELLSPGEYRALLSRALEGTVDADTQPPTPHTLYMPDAHRTALYVDSTVVQGDRGVGKTFWARSLLDAELREAAAVEYRISRLRRLHVTSGYGMDMSPHYPGPLTLPSLLDGDTRPEEIWYAILLTALGQPELRVRADWAERIAWLRANTGPAEATLAQADAQAAAEDVVELLVFDGLEHLHTDWDTRNRLIAELLRVAMRMRFGTRNIRLKVFLRPDMFEAAKQLFPDASKLSGNAARLEWNHTDLYGLLFHHLGNEADGAEQGDADAAARFRRFTGGWTAPAPSEPVRYAPPHALRNEKEAQEPLFARIAGPYMGTNVRQGRPYTWLPNHLMDSKGLISPRSFLKAIHAAAETTAAAHSSHPYALHHDAIRSGVREASTVRVDQISEDTPWVDLAIRRLAGCQVPITQRKVIDIWKGSDLPLRLREDAARYTQADRPELVRTGPRHPDDLPRLVQELIDLGVLRRRDQNHSDDYSLLDLPDIYRLAFGLGRLGGIPLAGR